MLFNQVAFLLLGTTSVCLISLDAVVRAISLMWGSLFFLLSNNCGMCSEDEMYTIHNVHCTHPLCLYKTPNLLCTFLFIGTGSSSQSTIW
jgi:hypothetical protein